MASDCTTHCPPWFYPVEDRALLGMDTLANTWLRGLLHAFPPIPRIASVLHRLRLSHLRFLQGFFFLQLTITMDLLSQLDRRVWHPSLSLLRLRDRPGGLVELKSPFHKSSEYKLVGCVFFIVQGQGDRPSFLPSRHTVSL